MKFKAKIIRVYNDKKSPVKAAVTIMMEYGDDRIEIRDIRLIDTGEKQFVAFSNRKRDGKYLDVCHPCNPATRKKIHDTVMSAYHSYVNTKQDNAAKAR